MAGELIGFVTCPAGKGRELARVVVEEKLVACVNIISSCRSVYIWQGKVEDEAEELLVIKTHVQKWQAFEKRMKEIHPYEVPEIICFAVEGGYAPYLKWIRSNLLQNNED
jgi:periplasmic divalent cation tolerance protein